jgi:hypothetical protein
MKYINSFKQFIKESFNISKSLDKKCIMFHGLGARPNANRAAMLEKLGYEVIQEQHDYTAEWNKDMGESFFKAQLDKAKGCDLIIGISFGGYIAYNLAKATGNPAILINPAIDRSKTKTEIKEYVMDYQPKPTSIELFCGENDISVPPQNAIEFVNMQGDDAEITMIPKMEHRVPDSFFKQILKGSIVSKLEPVMENILNESVKIVDTTEDDGRLCFYNNYGEATVVVSDEYEKEFFLKSMYDVSKSQWYLQNIDVERGNKKQGYGTSIMVKIFSEAFKNNVTEIYLHTSPKSFRFFKKLGFNVIDSVDKEIFMVKSFV